MSSDESGSIPSTGHPRIHHPARPLIELHYQRSCTEFLNLSVIVEHPPTFNRFAPECGRLGSMNKVAGIKHRFERGSMAYEDARRGVVWQAIVPARYPAQIVRVSSAEEAAVAVKNAIHNQQKVAVVSGGHSYVGNSLVDDCLLIDVSALDGVTIDRATMTATVGPGVRNGELDAVLTRAGLAFPLGHSPTVAVGGYLLGGGLGWNSEQWHGAACASVLSADVVLASGERARVSADENSDLFWALRGAGPLFCALVTSFELRLYERPTAIVELSASYPLDDAPALARWAELALPGKAQPVELSIMFSFTSDGRASCSVSAIAFADSTEACSDLLRPLADSLPASSSPDATDARFESRTMRELLAANDDPPARYSVETAWCSNVATAVTTAAAEVARATAAGTIIHLSLRSHVDVPGDAAFSVASAVMVFSSAVWDSEADDGDQRAWSDGVVDALAPITLGYYINETDYIRHPSRLNGCFTLEAATRLRSVRERFDPQRVFTAPGV